MTSGWPTPLTPTRWLAGSVRAVADIDGVTVTRAPAANAVFAVLPAEARERLQQDFDFYEWDDTTGEVRWMCSWDTTEADVDAFAAAVRTAVAGA